MSDNFARFTEKARKTCELALREALSLGHNYIGTEHLLLALMRQEDTLAYKVQVALGATPDAVRNEVFQHLTAKKEPEPTLAELLRKAADALDQNTERSHDG